MWFVNTIPSCKQSLKTSFVNSWFISPLAISVNVNPPNPLLSSIRSVRIVTKYCADTCAAISRLSILLSTKKATTAG